MSLTLVEWRRTVSELYAEVRSSSDPEAGHERWREGRARLLSHHHDSPVPEADRASYRGPLVAPYDPALRFEVGLDRDVAPQRHEVPTGTDGIATFDLLGRLHVPGIGSLDAWWLTSYAGGLFVPLKDGTSGRTSYGGGRYLIDTAKGADLGGGADWLVVDFNFAYYPSCAYDPPWACPLAPPGNVVAPPIVAGEVDTLVP